MTLSDASVTKWELPDLFSAQSGSSRRANTMAGSARKDDFQGGREAGFEQGRQEGLEAAQNEIREKTEMLENIISSLATPLAHVDTQIAKELIELSVRLAETIIHREVDLQPELVEKQVAEALATLSSKSTEISIRLHPEDARILESTRAKESDDSEGSVSDSSQYKIIADTNLHRGGCVLQTPQTLVDATIEKQLQDLLRTMLEKASEQ